MGGFTARGREAPSIGSSYGVGNSEEFRNASVAVKELITNFWEGTPKHGHVRPTWGGLPPSPGNKLPHDGGGIWERGMFLNTLVSFSPISPENFYIRQRLKSDWKWLTQNYTKEDFTRVGQHSPANFACDDAGFNSLTFLQYFDATEDSFALWIAINTVKNSVRQWRDNDLGGGLWYNDQRKEKSLYQVTIALASLKIYNITACVFFLDLAIAIEAWIRKTLIREDYLYWAATGRDGPIGKERPADIHTAGSVTYIGGEMAISLLQVRLALVTGQLMLRNSAMLTTKAVVSHMVDQNGILLDDRDAWTDGYFGADWAREVLQLAGAIGAETLRRTAQSIALHDRTDDGFYGADWGGLPDDGVSKWLKIGSTPQQIMTSSSAVNIIVAAALLPHNI